MCTTVVSIDPSSDVPVLLVGVRDEFTDRHWLLPDRHWADHAELVGGQDLQARGTWLAVQPRVPRVACVLNAHGEAAPDDVRLTRGMLPLRLAADGQFGDLEPARFDPFHLVCATPDSTQLWSWNGRVLTARALGPGLHVIVNSGLEGADDHEGPGDEQMLARIEYYRPLLEKAARPRPRVGSGGSSGDGTTDGSDGDDGDGWGDADIEHAWGAWLPLVSGAGLDPADERALVLRRTIEERQWGTSSVSLVALTRTAARYDFCANPADPKPTWSRVL